MALSILYNPKDADTPTAVDVVAVHGLGGNSTKTWTHPKSKALWLRDFLPLQIPDARIMTFGYNADAAFGQSTADVVDHAKSLLVSLIDKRDEPNEINRPLIFIAHSLGGIVVKQALFQTRLESRYRSIGDATLGLVFLGTPHRGSDKATYGRVLANVAQFVTHRPPARLLTALQTNSDVLLRLTTDFRFQLPDYQIYSFYEQRPMKGLSTLIVEKNSALLEVHHEEQIPVDADHSAICKFETESDDTFEKVYKRVKRMRNQPKAVVDESPRPSTNPLAEILAQTYKELNEAKSKGQKLEEKLFVDTTILRKYSLDRPRLVCSDPSCTDVRDDGSGMATYRVYKNVCLDPCFLDPSSSDPHELYLNAKTKKYPPFYGKDNCMVCGHGGDTHLPILHELKEERVRVKDTCIEAELKKNAADITSIQTTINDLLAVGKEN